MTSKEKFIEIYTNNIKREGADKLLEYLLSTSSDFFTAPASARFHSSYEGGLVDHSINVYECLSSYLESSRVQDLFGFQYSKENIAIVSLLHDLCKINVYKKGFRNVKDERGAWQRVDTFEYDDRMPYGHGEKSVYIISGFMRLTREEAMAINWHMGGFDPRVQNSSDMYEAFLRFPNAVLLHVSDLEATYLDEKLQ